MVQNSDLKKFLTEAIDSNFPFSDLILRREQSSRLDAPQEVWVLKVAYRSANSHKKFIINSILIILNHDKTKKDWKCNFEWTRLTYAYKLYKLMIQAQVGRCLATRSEISRYKFADVSDLQDKTEPINCSIDSRKSRAGWGSRSFSRVPKDFYLPFQA